MTISEEVRLGDKVSKVICMLEVSSGEFYCHRVSPWENTKGNLHFRTEFI